MHLYVAANPSQAHCWLGFGYPNPTAWGTRSAEDRGKEGTKHLHLSRPLFAR